MKCQIPEKALATTCKKMDRKLLLSCFNWVVVILLFLLLFDKDFFLSNLDCEVISISRCFKGHFSLRER